MGDRELQFTDVSKDGSRLFFEDAENCEARQPNTLAPGPQVNQDGEQLVQREVTLGTKLEEDTLEWSGGQLTGDEVKIGIKLENTSDSEWTEHLTRDEVKIGIKQENTSDSEWTEHLTTDEVKLGIKQEDSSDSEWTEHLTREEVKLGIKQENTSDSEWTEHLTGEEVKLRIKQEDSSDSEWTVEGPQDLEESGWIEEHFTGDVQSEIRNQMEEETPEPDEDEPGVDKHGCDVCGQQFSTDDLLARHMETSHGNIAGMDIVAAAGSSSMSTDVSSSADRGQDLELYDYIERPGIISGGMDSAAAGSSSLSTEPEVSNSADRGQDLEVIEQPGSINAIAGMDSESAGSSSMSTEAEVSNSSGRGQDLEVIEQPGRSIVNAGIDSESAVSSMSTEAEVSNSSDRGQDLELTEQPGSTNDIGPFSSAAGISRSHFDAGRDELPTVNQFSNGLVRELYIYLCKEMKISDRAFARKLGVLAGVSIKESNIVSYVSTLREKHAKIKRNKKGDARDEQLASLLHDQFLFCRETHRTPRVPDTPEKKKLREELSKSKAEVKGMKRKLVECEARKEELRDTLEQERVLSEVKMERLQSEVTRLQNMNEEARKEIQTLTANFDPCRHELATYKKMYERKLNKVSNSIRCNETKNKVSK